MITELLPAQTEAEIQAAVLVAVRELARGEPIVVPSETVYGLAADALNPTAVARIFEAKERPFFDPLICHLPTHDWLARLTRPLGDRGARVVGELTTAFWPGPLTLVLPREVESVPDLVAAGLPTVAVRMSAHPVLRAVLLAFDRPLAAPSANRFGRISPTTGAHAFEELSGRIPLVLEAGPTAHGIESTIVRVTDEGEMEVLRPGPITVEMLVRFGPVRAVARGDALPVAPGQLDSHYAPTTRLRLLGAEDAEPAARKGLLAFRAGGQQAGYVLVEVLSPEGDLRAAAANLFAALRRLDAAGLELIEAESAPPEGLGVAINDRLFRAATK